MGRRGRPDFGFGTGPVVRGGRRATTQKLGPGARERLVEAHAAKAAGDHARAAETFAEVARIARERGMSRVAATLSAQAAGSAARAGDHQGLVRATEDAIGDALRDADADHAARTFGELLETLGQTEFSRAVPEMEGAIRAAIGVSPAQPGAGEIGRSQRRHVAEACAICGATPDGATVRFGASGIADCPSCGGILA